MKDVALSVRAGEIFGVAGVAGNGQNEFLSAISGETLALNPEAIVLASRPVGRLRANERRNIRAFARFLKSATATRQSASSRSPTMPR